VTSSYLFDSKGLVTLASYVAPDTLFAFDLDGTLAPIGSEDSAVRVSEPVRTTLERLVKLAKVAVFTGRTRVDALAILGLEPHLLIGNHGAEWPPHENGRNWQFVGRCLKWRDQLGSVLFYAQGVVIEFKGESISLHYPKANDPGKALSLINAAIDNLVPSPRRIDGNYVVNLLPTEALTKGEALMATLDKFGTKRAIFFGNDAMDDEVFQLEHADVFGIHIGEDQTAASFHLNNQSEILGLLNSMVGVLEMAHEQETSISNG